MIVHANIKSLLLSLSSGYSFRSKVEHSDGGDLYVLQMKDIDEQRLLTPSTLTRIDGSSIGAKYLLRQGDILFLSKGANNFAVEYGLSLSNVVAASAFFVLRPDLQKIVPSYLTWYINQAPVQRFLKEKMAGTYIPNITKGTIESIEVALPALETQHKIAEMDKLRRQEHQLMQQITEKRQTIVNAYLLGLAHY